MLQYQTTSWPSYSFPGGTRLDIDIILRSKEFKNVFYWRTKCKCRICIPCILSRQKKMFCSFRWEENDKWRVDRLSKNRENIGEIIRAKIYFSKNCLLWNVLFWSTLQCGFALGSLHFVKIFWWNDLRIFMPLPPQKKNENKRKETRRKQLKKIYDRKM